MFITVIFLSEFSAQLLRLLFFADREERIIRISKFEKCRRVYKNILYIPSWDFSYFGYFSWMERIYGENIWREYVRDEKLKRHVEKFGERKVGLIN